MTSALAGGNRRIDRVLHPDFVQDLESLSLEEVRSRRQDADQEEVDLSYLRRMLQGRSDITQAELSRRASGAAAGSLTEEEVVSRLTAVLGDEGHDRSPAQGLGRHRSVEPSRVGETRRSGEALLAQSGMAELGDMSEADLREQLADLAAQEHEISQARKQVQVVLDTLSAEITRRYRDGSATVDALLNG